MKGESGTSVWDIRLPAPVTALQGSHLRQPPTWIQYLSESEAAWTDHMRNHDSPEQRWRDKNTKRFRLP